MLVEDLSMIEKQQTEDDGLGWLGQPLGIFRLQPSSLRGKNNYTWGAQLAQSGSWAKAPQRV